MTLLRPISNFTLFIVNVYLITFINRIRKASASLRNVPHVQYISVDTRMGDSNFIDSALGLE